MQTEETRWRGQGSSDAGKRMAVLRDHPGQGGHGGLTINTLRVSEAVRFTACKHQQLS